MSERLTRTLVDFAKLSRERRAYRGEGEPKQTSTHTLDCPECGSWFENFTTLAAHVVKSHQESPRAAAAKQVQEHFTLNDRIEENFQLTSQREDHDMKLPKTKGGRASSGSRVQSSTRLPKAEASEQSADFNPFIKAEHVGRTGKQAVFVLTGEMRGPTRSTFGDQIIIEVKHRGSLFDWGVKLNSPNHRMLEELVGNESTKWRGKKIPVTVLENLGRDYIAIDRPSRDASASPKRNARKSKTAKRRR